MYDIDYNDERFREVESDRQEALTENEKLYGDMVADSEKYYQAQIDASKEWATTQQKLQQEKTDFAIEQIEQQKDQEAKDYKKEQSGAYVDWQRESNRYGANAEQMAAQGLSHSGYSESSQVSMYNTYQNRIAAARENYNLAILNFDNAIKDARLQNNSVLAEIAYQALQQQLELSLQGFQYKNQLLNEKANQKAQIESRYDSEYQAVLDQINKENALAEEVRQYNANLAEEQRQFNAQAAAAAGESGSSSGGSANGTYILGGDDNTAIKPVATGLQLGDVLPKNTVSELGLSKDANIISSNGNYYIKEGRDYIDITSLEQQITSAQNTSNKYNNVTERKKMTK